MQKRVAAIHDLSCFGRCSLTVILPVLAASGAQGCPIPTALFSSHTGGLPGYTCRDLSADMLPIARQWHHLGLRFDAVYSGFLGSAGQAETVSQIFSLLSGEGTLRMVDPAMADNGRLYATCTPELVHGMRALCRSADLIVPNMTEAAFLLGEEFYDGPYDRAHVRSTLQRLSEMGPRRVVLTGVWYAPGEVGAAGYDHETGRFSSAFTPRVQGSFPGTGDLFAAALLAALLRGKPLGRALQAATGLVFRSVGRTRRDATDPRFGVDFEQELPWFWQELSLRD